MITPLQICRLVHTPMGKLAFRGVLIILPDSFQQVHCRTTLAEQQIVQGA
jgi:hypothetical protein